MQVLGEMAEKFKYERRHRAFKLSDVAVALPQKRSFHAAFLPFAPGAYCACDVRSAYFAGLDAGNVTYVPLATETVQQVRAGQQWVSASFVTPYPPGFPVVVPGQVITNELLLFFQHIKVKEIHGFSFENGFKVFTDAFLQTAIANRNCT
jgi:arginine decarboxylase